MGGDNMEDLLMGAGDSSSGESDSETPPNRVAPAPAAISREAQVQQLKSMYSPATKKPSVPPQPQSLQIPPQQQPRPVQPPQQMRPSSQPRSSQPQQQSYRTSSGGSHGGIPTHPQQAQLHSQQQQQQQRHHAQMQAQHHSAMSHPPQQQQQQPSSRGGMPPQQPPSSSRGGMPPPQVSSRGGVPHQRPTGMVQQSRSSQPPHPQAAMMGMAPPKRQVPTRHSSDPYEPTPVSKIMAKQQQQQQQQQQTRRMPPSANSSLSSNSLAAQELKKQKERFLVFTKVLMKYLEQKEPNLHQQVKAVIKECAERNKNKEPGYESVTASMRKRLREIVNDQYWKRAELYLDHFLKERAQGGSKSAMMLQSTSSSSSTTLRPPTQESAARRTTPQSQQSQRLLSNIQEEIKRKNQAASSKVSSKSTSAFQAPKQKNPSSKTTKTRQPSVPSQPQPQRRMSQTATTTTTTSPVPRGFDELMQQVDNALNFDWTVAGRVLGPKTSYMLSDEQKTLLYDCKPNKEPIERVVTFPRPGWSERNVISSRVAWSRIRLREKRRMEQEQIAPGVPGLPSPAGEETTSRVVIESKQEAKSSELTEWYNEEKAEGDAALAVLSEGLQIYIKDVLEKALHCARQRQNLDGIRLWHQQLALGSTKPALSLRLGCDVNRQVALAQGNAAMTCKRMEEALERQTNIPDSERDITPETLAKASSMSDLSLRPKLGKTIQEAEMHGKRSFDVYGGKDSQEPPFGRVPKQAKLEVVDFQSGMYFSRRRRRHRAGTLASTFFY